jgi:hypothetical protein
VFLADFVDVVGVFGCASHFKANRGLGLAWVCGSDHSIFIWAIRVEFAWISFILNREEYHDMGATKLEENKLSVRLGSEIWLTIRFGIVAKF